MNNFVINSAVFMMVAASIANSPAPKPLTLVVVPYYINAGDTFWLLANKNRVPLEAVLVANPNASTTNLQIGQKINLPTKQ